MIKKMKLIVGRSGSGKTYITRALGISCVVSNTTRPIRKDKQGNPIEKNGVDYNFFNSCPVKEKTCPAYTERDGYKFWATEADLKGKDAFIIDVPGVERLMAYYTLDFKERFDVVYINCPLWKRIRNMRKRSMPWINIIRRLWVDRTFNGIDSIEHTTINM